jgi:hypothetical protein
VVYASSSSALATGSALTFDGTNFGVGETSPTNAIHVKRTSGASIIKTQATDTASYASIDAQSNSGSGTIYRFGSTYSTSGQYIASSMLLESSAGPLSISSTNAELRFYTSNTEQLRLTSSSLYTASGINVGIGTSSPRAKLEVTNGTTNTAGEAVFQAYVVGADTGSLTEGNVTVQSNDAMAINKGGSIAFGGRAVSANTAGANWARIAGLKEDGTSSQYSGYLQFATRSTAGGMTEKARFNSTGALVFAGGTTTADGIGITFPATQSASSNANTLDDYEEGTTTVTLTAGTTPPTTPPTTTAYYTKIGNLVTVSFLFSNVDITGAVGLIKVTGMPFATTNSFRLGSIANGRGPNVMSSSYISGTELYQVDYAGNTLNWASVGVGTYVFVTITYQT